MRTNVIKSGLFAGAVLAAAFAVCEPLSAAGKEVVAYRLTRWKTVHFEDAELAKKHVATMKILGCQFKQESHGGHIDVSYYCPQWKEGTVATHAIAHQWEKWLRGAGFETKHAH